METGPRSPIVVLGKQDDYLGTSLTPKRAFLDTEAHLDSDGQPEDPVGFDYFDAAGRTLQPNLDDKTLVLGAQVARRDEVRQRIGELINARADLLRAEDPPRDLSILELPEADIPFELLCWRLYAILGVEFEGEADHIDNKTAAHKMWHKFGGRH